MFICSKLRQNLSEMEVRTFVRIQRVIWDHVLAFKGEIIQKQDLLSFPCRNWIIIIALFMLSVLFFLVLFSSLPKSFFLLNHVRIVQKRCSHSRFSSQATILGVFDWKVSLCWSCSPVANGRYSFFVGQAMTWGEQKILIKSGFLPLY